MSMDFDEPINEVEEIYEVIKPYASSLTSTFKNFFCSSNDKRMFAVLKMEAMKLRHEERMKILELVRELADKDKLTEDMFKLLMIAFAG